MSDLVLAAYKDRLQSGSLNEDHAQALAAEKLDQLAQQLCSLRLAPGQSSIWPWSKTRNIPSPRGLYIWGDVGRGKTMLMDLFYQTLPISAKKRMHFHAFMQDVHKRIFAWRQAHKPGHVKGDDPIPPLAQALFEEAWLLCFDEFSVTDITDAMILGRLFEALFAKGVVLVATSNVPPQRLYENGLNRALFLPFIGLIEKYTQILHLEAACDFRLRVLTCADAWITPADSRAREKLDEIFALLTHGQTVSERRLTFLGRELIVPQAAGVVARFSFSALCEAALGAADFLALADAFEILIIDDIRAILPQETNIARRFIVLIDALYDVRVKLIASANVAPEHIYSAANGREAFEIERTISRLIEMTSEDYFAQPHRRSASEPKLSCG